MPALDSALESIVERALAEDVRTGDATSEALVPSGLSGQALLVARKPTVVAGLDVARRCFERLDAGVVFAADVKDGDVVDSPRILATITGSLRGLLTAERTALNVLQRACGIAAATRECVEIVRGTGVAILDTRKTAPGLRALDKLAVRLGGGRNHRMALDDMILVKDNHVALAGSLAEAVRRALDARRGLPVEVEVDSLAQVEELLSLPRLPDWVLLDNFTPDEVRAAVGRIAGALRVESSGGIGLRTLRQYAEARPDAISLGFLTHSVTAADLALDLGEAAAPDVVDAAAIRSRLDGTRFTDVRALGTLESTIDSCRELAEGGAPQGLVVIASSQRRGRGQRGARWFSPAGGGTYLSALLRPDLHPEDLGILTVAAGLAAGRALRGLGVPCSIKLPNDLLVPDASTAGAWRKVGGVLVDAAVQGARVRHAIVSLGVNVRLEPGTIPEVLRGHVASIAESGAPAATREDVAVAFLAALDAILRGQGEGHEAWASALARERGELLAEAGGFSTPLLPPEASP